MNPAPGEPQRSLLISNEWVLLNILSLSLQVLLLVKKWLNNVGYELVRSSRSQVRQ
jgi:predicted DCC family thiol-disulfide oxidoreductase YuxK